MVTNAQAAKAARFALVPLQSRIRSTTENSSRKRYDVSKKAFSEIFLTHQNAFAIESPGHRWFWLSADGTMDCCIRVDLRILWIWSIVECYILCTQHKHNVLINNPDVRHFHC
jgi:hypothetical protein